MERGDRAAVATFAAPAPLAVGRVALGESAAHHARVRRLEPGARIRLTDGAGITGAGTISRLTKSVLEADVEGVERIARPPAVHLFVPVADRDRMLWLAEKACELAVASWRPVTFARSRSVSPRGEGPAFGEKVRARMLAALEQSGGAWLPEVHPECDVSAAAASLPDAARLVLDRDGKPILARAFGEAAAILVGPEGGIEPGELETLVGGGWRRVALGATTLRFETAALAATAVARAALSLNAEG